MACTFSKLLTAEKPKKNTDLSLYGRLVGEWDFDWSAPQPDGTVLRHKGEWVFSYILEGTAVQDVFICPSSATRGTDTDDNAEYGTTLRFPLFDGSRKWQVIYGCDRGRKIDRLIAEKVNGDIIQTGINYDLEDTCIWRWDFTRITENSFHWEAKWSVDSGQVWNIVCELDAVRRK